MMSGGVSVQIKKRSKLWLFLTLFVIILAVATAYLRVGLAILADTIFAHNVPDNGRELPPTSYPIPPSSADFRYVGGKAEGISCSVSAFVQALAFERPDNAAPVGLQVRQACTFHDYCYRHGLKTYGYSQADCDFLLQEHTFRLCDFISKQDEKSQSMCQSRARLVTLGVRAAGFGSFQTKESSYFEFDPFPYKANLHRVFRIADAPNGWKSSGAVSKALYIFDVRRSGTNVTIFGWDVSGRISPEFKVCFQIPGRFGSINAAPIVVRTGGKQGEDWFVWWQRKSLDTTVGRFAMLAPARALRKDWAQIAGAESATPKCSFSAIDDLQQDEIISRAAVAVTKQINPKGSEYHGRLWSSANSKQIELTTLTTHSCIRGERGVYLICYRDLAIELPQTTTVSELPLKATIKSWEAWSIRTGKYHTKTHKISSLRGKEREFDRYRSFVLPPMDLKRGDEHFIAFARRGEADGTGYENTVTLRRFGKLKHPTLKRGQSYGSVILNNLPESADPLLLVGTDNADRATALAVQATEAGLILKYWPLPKLGDGKQQAEYISKIVDARLLPACNRKALPNSAFRNFSILSGASSRRPYLLFQNRPIDDTTAEKVIRVSQLQLDLDKLSIDKAACFKLKKFDVVCSKIGLNDSTCVDAQRSWPLYEGDLNNDGKKDIIVINLDNPSMTRAIWSPVFEPATHSANTR